MMTVMVTALDVQRSLPCSFCDAAADAPCVNPATGVAYSASYLHAARFHDAVAAGLLPLKEG